jgi:photosystem II stability/assembly factor-like uncharacterized protein
MPATLVAPLQRAAGLRPFPPRAAFLFALALSTVVAGCVDIAGTSAGDDCNPNGICVTGLLCEEGVCKPEEEVQWERMNRPGQQDLNGVFGTAPDNMFAVGDDGTILRYRGQGLDWVDAKHGLDVKGDLHRIWGRPGSIWAVGQKAILFWDGASWTRQQAFDSEGKEIEDHYLNGIHGAGDHVYAVGGRSYPPYDKLVLRYDASNRRWDQVQVDLSYTPMDVWVTSAGHLFVVGTALHVKHFDGTTWREQNLDASSAVALRAIWGTADGGKLHAVGASGTLATYAGGSWTVKGKARLSFKANDLFGLDAEDLFVVGDTPSSYSTSASLSGIERCSRFCTYNPVPKDVRSKALVGIWISDDQGTAFVVGNGGTILRRRLR